MVLATLTGFLVGSLLKIWPWKNATGEAPVVVHSDGREEWMMLNVLPANFDGNPQILSAIILLIVGFAIVLLLEKVGSSREQTA